MPLSEDSLMQYLVDDLALEPDEIGADVELFDEGLLDSMSVAELLMFIESEAGFRISPEEITLDNIGSINKILDFARRKRAE